MKKKYSIAKEYSRYPGPRYEWQGERSGQHFLETVLLDMFDEAVSSGEVLEINLDCTVGYGSSFLEEAFGGLVRKRDKSLVKKHLSFVSEEEEYLIDEINEYIDSADTLTNA